MSTMEDAQAARSLPGRNPKPRELPAEAVEVLKAWLFSPEHFHNPYPTHEETAELSQRTGLKRIQIKNWFVNARRRCWKRAKANQQNALTSGAVGSVPIGTMGFTTPNAVDHDLAIAKSVGGVMDISGPFNLKQAGMGEHGVAGQSLAYHALPQPGTKGDYRNAYQGNAGGVASISPMSPNGIYETQPMHHRIFQIPPKATGASSGHYLNSMLIAPKVTQPRAASFQDVGFALPNGVQPSFGISPSLGLGKPPKKEELKPVGASTSQTTSSQKRSRNPNQPSWARYTPIEDRVLLDWAKTHHWKSPKGVKLWKELSQKWSQVAPNLPQRPWQSLRDRYLRLVHERKKKGKGDSNKRAKVAVHDTHGPGVSTDSRISSSSAVPFYGSSDMFSNLNLTQSTESDDARVPARAKSVVVRHDVPCAICGVGSESEPVDGMLQPCGHIVHVRCFFKCNQDFVRRSSQSDGVPDNERAPVPVPKCPVCQCEVLDCDSVLISSALGKTPPPPGPGILRALDMLEKVEPVSDASSHPFLTAVPTKYEENAAFRADVKDGQEEELYARFERASIDIWRVRLVKNSLADLLEKEEARVGAIQIELPEHLAERVEEIRQGFSDSYAQLESQANALGSTWQKPRTDSVDSVDEKAVKEETGNGGFSKDSISSSVTDSCAPTPSQSMDFVVAGADDGFATTEKMEKACQIYISYVELYCNTIEDLRQIK